MRVMDVYMYGIDLVSVIVQSVLAHDTKAPLLASWYGAISYNLQSPLVFVQGKENSARYIE